MDEVGLRELVKAGVRFASRKWKEQDPGEAGSFAGTDPDILTVLDRLAQLGLIALEHQQTRLWSEVVDGLLGVYRLGVSDDGHSYRLPESNTWLLVEVIHRVLFLGAAATRLRMFDHVRTLALQRPLESRPETYWIRYSVTLAARGEVKEAFKGKSLIGPASERVRERPQFFGQFEENLDNVVNHMCQFDFLHCVAAVATAKDLWSCYPNFAGYYSFRTMPVVFDLIRNGPSRAVIPDITDAGLAQIIRDLDSLAKEQSFEIAGWDGYQSGVYDFIQRQGRDESTT